MKRLVHVLLALPFCMFANALLAQNAPVASGGNGSSAAGSVSYSVGQVVYTYVESSTGAASQGVQQPYEFYTLSVDPEYQEVFFQLYPNPTTDFIQLNIDAALLGDLSFRIIDVQGQVLLTQEIYSTSTSVNLNAFSSGTYFVHLYKNQHSIKIVRLIKQ